MEKLFRGHADRIAEVGCDYLSSGVNYEQSIVAPAADILLQVYLLTKEEKYLPPLKEGLLGPDRIGERVKVLENRVTGKYVMLIHTDDMKYCAPASAWRWESG